ncbi:MAG: sulfite exporter TauE/SafE family protein [Sphingobacteriales bacterium]|nr:sulfite exporter TauE/SafE family protein [Sphingobacteriales bacterium]
MPVDLSFYPLLLLVAFLYASVGHGGASGYLALMAFFSFPSEAMRPAALLLNIFVSLIAFIQYYRIGYFQWKLFWPFAIASIPASFAGGLFTLDDTLYKKVLGVLLIFPIVKLAGLKFKPEGLQREVPFYAALLTGTLIGFLSGMIGIGGGIILSPVILLLHWADMKQTAAVSALFIFVNSLAGLAGLFTTGFEYKPEMGWMIAVAFAGGLAGSYLGALKFNSLLLKRILAAVLLIASVKLLFT